MDRQRHHSALGYASPETFETIYFVSRRESSKSGKSTFMPSAKRLPSPVEVFYSYSHKDEALRVELENHLSTLRREGVITGWHDRQIRGGTEWKGKIDEHLKAAKVILLLISSDFMASDYCADVEMEQALERHSKGLARVIPVILRACEWKIARLSELQALPTDGKPVTSWPNRDEALTNIAQGIRQVIDEVVASASASAPGTSGESKSGVQPRKATRASPRSRLSANPPRMPPIWNVPHRRNHNFIGRDKLLNDLQTTLNSQQIVTLAAIHGLGGVGKTQIASEYAYRHATEYDLVWWVRSEEPATLASDYATLAQELNLRESNAQDQTVIVEAVRRWLEHHSRWLLVFDNAQTHQDLDRYLPQASMGHVIVTSRNPNWLSIGSPLPVTLLERAASVDFLLKRTGRTGQHNQDVADELAEELGDLPLALEQAGAYIEEEGISFSDYLELLMIRRQGLLQAVAPPRDYPDTVATTWDVSFHEVQEQSPAAADLLYLCAFLAPDDIPLEIFQDEVKHLPERLARAVKDPLAFNTVKGTLRRYSLVNIDPERNTLTIHRLVQAVTRDRLPQSRKRAWKQTAMALIDSAFPDNSSDVATWSKCTRLLLHALITVQHVESIKVASPLVAKLLNKVNIYLRGRAQLMAAKAALERVLAIDDAIHGSEHSRVEASQLYLTTEGKEPADILKARTILEAKLTRLEEELKRDQITYGPEHPKVAVALNNVGLMQRTLGNFTRAQEYYEKAQASFEKALGVDVTVFGSQYPAIAIDLNNLGFTLRQMGDFTGAQEALERALSIDEATYGPNHLKVGIRAYNLYLVLEDQKKSEEAQVQRERARRILQEALNEEHNDIEEIRELLKELGGPTRKSKKKP
jgi:tetratricopeptide (TPR) repeat protein